MIVQTKPSVMRPFDIALLLKKITPEGMKMNGKELAASLSISAAEISTSMERSRIAQLVDNTKQRVNILALRDFLVYGIRYCFPAQPGGLSRGIPTASSAAIIKSIIVSGGESFVWKHPEGTERGQAIVPLYPNAPEAAVRDADFHSLLAIVDSLRIGQSRERQAAIDELNKYFDRYAGEKQ